MAKSVPVIFNELAQGLQELRAAFAEMAVRQAPTTPPEETNDLKKILISVERQVIERVMRSVKGNQSRGAQMLNISRGSLIVKMKLYGIENFRYLKKAALKGEARKRQIKPKRPTAVRAVASPAKPSRQVKALRVLHGRYLGALRGLDSRSREKVRRIREEKGYAGALAAAAMLK